MGRSRFEPFCVGVLLAAALFGCQAGAPIGTMCERTSECATPLVCRIGRCRTECVGARDCPAGQACLVNQDGLGACELPAIDVCSISCDAPLICAAGHCRVECTMDHDCPEGHVCVSSACQRADAIADAGPIDAAVVVDAAGTDAAQAIDSGNDAASVASDTGPRPDGDVDAGYHCNPFDGSGCLTGLRCGLMLAVPSCIIDGTGAGGVGAACTVESNCALGHSCQGGHCVRVCAFGDDAACGVDLACTYDSVSGQSPDPFPRNGVGLCSQTCDLVGDTGCFGTATCAWGTVGSASGGIDFTWCRDVGASTEGTACGAAYQCARGLDCYLGFCRAMCAFPGGTCPTSRHCDSSSATSFHGRGQISGCIP